MLLTLDTLALIHANALPKTSSIDPIAMLTQYGALGIVVALLFGYARITVKREQDRGDRLEALLMQRNKDFEQLVERVIPPIVEATRVTGESIDVMTKMAARLSFQDEHGRGTRGL